MDLHASCLLVRCQQCHIELLPGAQFCHGCGSQVQPLCQSCQTVNPPGSSFCFSCGNSLQPGSSTLSTAAEQASVGQSALACPRCQERNEISSTYCYSCGLPLNNATPQNAATTRDTDIWPNIIEANVNVANMLPAFALGRPGGFWIRLLAYVIDSILLAIVFSIAWPLLSGESIMAYWFPPEAADADLFSFEFWVASDSPVANMFRWSLDTLYFTGAIAIWATTAGKKPFGLYVVRSDGSKIGFGRALARHFAYYVSFFTLGFGFIMIAFRSDKRGLHDLICDTVVIRR